MWNTKKIMGGTRNQTTNKLADLQKIREFIFATSQKTIQIKKNNQLKISVLTGYFYAFCGLDGTRTRDLRRDRAAF